MFLTFFVKLVSVLILLFLFTACESIDNISGDKPSDKNHGDQQLNRLEEMAKSALAIRVYSIIDVDPASGRNQPTYLANGKLILLNPETQEKRMSNLAKNGINLFLDIEPGKWLLHQLQYDDPLSYPLLNLLFQKIDDKVMVLLDKEELSVEVEPRKLQYGGDFSVMMTKKGLKTSPPEFQNEEKDLKKTSELIMSNFPHSRWTVWAMKILKTTGGF